MVSLAWQKKKKKQAGYVIRIYRRHVEQRKWIGNDYLLFLATQEVKDTSEFISYNKLALMQTQNSTFLHST